MTEPAEGTAGYDPPPVRPFRREKRSWLMRPATALAETFLAERGRWFLWLPVAMGVGIALYFALDREPAWWAGAAILAAATVAIAGGWRRPGVRLGAIVLAAAALGFCVAQWRAHGVAAPVIEKRTRAVMVSGQVATVEARPTGLRVVIDEPRVGDLGSERTPRRVRVTVRTDGHPPRPGEWIEVRAVLMPPPPPPAPGAFDFPRQAWFKGLGAVGFAVGKIKHLPDATTAPSFSLWLNGRRQEIAERIRENLDRESGAIAAALMTGDRGAIPKDVVAALRDAGLAHLLAISGLHVGLIAAALFVAVRGLLALWPAVALRFPIKNGVALVQREQWRTPAEQAQRAF